NTFHSYWTANVETEFRHPLLQGSGVDFNRVAGPYATPGNYNGVVLARINTDISLAEFELGLRDVVSGVEDAYWNLYFAYRKLDAKIASRNAAYTAWQEIKAKGEDRPEEIEARMAYLTAEQEVQDALTGRLGETSPSLVNNPSQGSVPTPLQTVSGLQVLERRLRLLMGMPINDGQIIVPTLDPSPAPVAFEWDEVTSEALARRSELKRQRQQIKRAELQLAASRNFLLPRFDLVGRYRWRGFGHSLLNAERDLPDPIDNAYASMVSGDYQEWRVGGELTFPVGFRQAHAAVRFAQLQVARDKAVLQEQERHVINDLSNAYAELRNVQEVVRRMYNLRVAAHERVAKIEERRQVGGLPGTEGDTPDEDRLRDQLMEARRRASEADIEYYAALVSYAKSIKGVHFQKGSLLEYNNIFLAEDTWGGKRSTRPPAEMNYQLDPSRRGEVLDPSKGEFELPAELEPRSPSDKAANPDLLEGVAPPAFQDRRGRTSLPPADAYSPPDAYTPSDAYVPSDAPGAGVRSRSPRVAPDAPPTADLLEDVSPPQFRSSDLRGAAGFSPVVVAPTPSAAAAAAPPAAESSRSGVNGSGANGSGLNISGSNGGGENRIGASGVVAAPAVTMGADASGTNGRESASAELANRERRMSTTTINRDGSTVRAARSASQNGRAGAASRTGDANAAGNGLSANIISVDGEGNGGESTDSGVAPRPSTSANPPIGIEKPASDLLNEVSPPTFQAPARRGDGRTSAVAPGSARQAIAAGGGGGGSGAAIVRR
ncbi:MAG TPA: TolC family protein, partial [Pirellulaceae bacterium]|nr:TolC family protein [Pirellulaceae bacterium]